MHRRPALNSDRTANPHLNSLGIVALLIDSSSISGIGIRFRSVVNE